MIANILFGILGLALFVALGFLAILAAWYWLLIFDGYTRTHEYEVRKYGWREP